jgi:purine-binding chemotaxis protein CheW
MMRRSYRDGSRPFTCQFQAEQGTKAVAEELREVLIFEVAGQRYGLPALDVQELLRMAALTPLPSGPPIVEGVINIRGKVVPVLDLRTRFRLPAKAAEHTDHVVVARAGERQVALRVDRALELRSLAPADLQDTEGVMPGVDYVAQLAKLPDGLVLIHDLRTFLSHAEAADLDQALAREESRQ